MGHRLPVTEVTGNHRAPCGRREAESLAQEQAKQANRVATQQAETAIDALRSSARDTVRPIRAFAEMQPKPDVVYNTAQIPPPSPPSPAPPPARTTDLTVTLSSSDGALTLRWKASNPAGTSLTNKKKRGRRRPRF